MEIGIIGYMFMTLGALSGFVFGIQITEYENLGIRIFVTLLIAFIGAIFGYFLMLYLIFVVAIVILVIIFRGGNVDIDISNEKWS